MTQKLFRIVTIGLIGCTLIAPFSGCDSVNETKPTIDTSTPIKAPAAPTTQKVEAKPGK